ncbi:MULTISPECIES: RrF2 family transcriptional regulator [Rothia]|uniref:Rrf2 family transcriptional regulator n=1 Tax=Rothia nasimurium TaxID=85336 RepID=A0A1Y1RM91_9MICC|nr:MULTISPECIES: Rrf2 family transcriptional regulator [Rothia]ORC15554.1 hypothetical protein A7979_07440 [Rothia nasimurium]
MKLSSGVEYISHCLVVLAIAEPNRPVPRRILSQMFDIPEAFLAKQLQMLSKAEIINASTGPSGGFTLAQNALEISLLDVVEALEGRRPFFNCSEIRCKGIFSNFSEEIKKQGNCAIHKSMIQAEEQWRSSLSQSTISNLVNSLSPKDRGFIEDFLKKELS